MIRQLFSTISEIDIYDFLKENEEFDFTVSEISKYTGLSRKTSHEKINTLSEKGLIQRTRIIGRSKFYSVAYNQVTDLLEKAESAHMLEMELNNMKNYRRYR